jgi:sorting nexin-1/2
VEEPPAPPQKEQAARNAAAAAASSGTASLRGMMESVDLGEEQQEVSGTGFVNPRPIPPGSNDAQKRATQPSLSVEQAAKPTFDIAVGDPHKVGDLTGSHTVYQVRTKVCCTHPPARL